MHKEAIPHNGLWGKGEGMARKSLLLALDFDLIIYDTSVAVLGNYF